MPITINIILKSLKTKEKVLNTGRATQALLLNSFRILENDLSDYLKIKNLPRPYRVSPIINVQKNLEIKSIKKIQEVKIEYSFFNEKKYF